MDIPKITDGEFNIMNTLWENGPLPATDIVRILNRDIGWNRNTTYTFINRLVNKQVIHRDEPGFVCTPLYSRDAIASFETRSLINKMFGGSLKTMVASFLEADASAKEIAEVKQMIAHWEEAGGECIGEDCIGEECNDKDCIGEECNDKDCIGEVHMK